MSTNKVLDIKTGRPTKKSSNNKIKAQLWDKMFQLMKEGLLGVVIADTKLSKLELDAMVEVWLEELVIDAQTKKRYETAKRLRKRRLMNNNTNS